MKLICPTCGESNSIYARFCGDCGQPVVGKEPIANSGTVFTGRQFELKFFQAKLSEATAGRGALTLVVGEAGIGKTALAQQFAAQAEQAGAIVLWGACFEGEWRPPYGPWVEALSNIIRAMKPEHLRRHLGAGAPSLAQIIPHLHTLLPDTPIPTALSPNEERFRLYDALAQFLLRLTAEQPVVLILDDLHWADPDSLEALRYVARFARQGSLLLVDLYREAEMSQDDRHQTAAALWREADYERLLITGLTRQEVAGYLAQAAQQPELLGALVILDAPFLPPPEVEAGFHQLLAGLRSPMYREVMQQMADTLAFLPTDDQERKARIVAGMCATPQQVLVSSWEQFLAYDSAAAAAACRIPTLYIGSVFPANLARFKELCPQLVTAQTVGVGHFHQLEAPAQVNAMIERFLAVSLNPQPAVIAGVIR